MKPANVFSKQVLPLAPLIQTTLCTMVKNDLWTGCIQQHGEEPKLESYHTKYDEMAEYDCMGNPTWIYRRSPDVIDDVRPSSPSDRLRLEYDGNRLVHVTDSVTSGHNYAGAFAIAHFFSPWQCPSELGHCSSGFTKKFHFADGADEAVEYEYDGNGNMTKDSASREQWCLHQIAEAQPVLFKDLNRNITSIEYNLLNLALPKIGCTSEILKYIWHSVRFALSLPSMINFGDNSFISYTYSATGEKLRVLYGLRMQPVLSPTGQDASLSSTGDASDVSSPLYDRAGVIDPGLPVPFAAQGTVYCGNVVYDGDDVRLLTSEGYVTFTATGAPQYHYFLRDHLGNVRVVMGQTGALEQVNHYYAFGGPSIPIT